MIALHILANYASNLETKQNFIAFNKKGALLAQIVYLRSSPFSDRKDVMIIAVKSVLLPSFLCQAGRLLLATYKIPEQTIHSDYSWFLPVPLKL